MIPQNNRPGFEQQSGCHQHKEEAEAVQDEKGRMPCDHVAKIVPRRDFAGDLGESHDGPEVRRIAERDADDEKDHRIRLLLHVLVEIAFGESVESVLRKRRCWQ